MGYFFCKIVLTYWTKYYILTTTTKLLTIKFLSMRNYFRCQTLDAWYRFRVETGFNVNLKWLIYPFALLAYAILWIAELIYMAGKYVAKAIVYIAKKIWLVLLFLWSLLVALWLWFIGLFKTSNSSPNTVSFNKKWLWLVLMALLLVALFSINFRGCIPDPTPTPAEPSVITATQPEVKEAVDKAWYDVVISRVYLDYKGEKNIGGLKFIEGEPVKEADLKKLASVVDNSWKQLITREVKVKLSHNQMVATTLLAMRMGENGFPVSKFLSLLNQGDYIGARNHFYLYDKNGNKIETREEASQYLRVLTLIWDNLVTTDMLLDFAHHSYRNTVLTQTDDEFLETMKKTSGNPIVRNIINLEE